MARHRNIWWEQMTVYKTTLYWVPMTWQDTGTYDGSRWQSIKLHYIGAHDMARHRNIWWEQMTVYKTTLYWVPMTWQDTGTYDGSRWQSRKLHYIGCPWHGKTQEHMMGADDSLENYIILGAHDMARHRNIWWEQMTVYKTTLYWVPMTWQDTGTYDGKNYIILRAYDMARHSS